MHNAPHESSFPRKSESRGARGASQGSFPFVRARLRGPASAGTTAKTSITTQRGWVGLIVLLITLVIVAMLAQTVLKQYGLWPGPAAQRSAVPGEAGGGMGIGAAPLDPGGATSVPANALERARGVESTLQQQTHDLDKRIDKQLE